MQVTKKTHEVHRPRSPIFSCSIQTCSVHFRRSTSPVRSYKRFLPSDFAFARSLCQCGVFSSVLISLNLFPDSKYCVQIDVTFRFLVHLLQNLRAIIPTTLTACDDAVLPAALLPPAQAENGAAQRLGDVRNDVFVVVPRRLLQHAP